MEYLFVYTPGVAQYITVFSMHCATWGGGEHKGNGASVSFAQWGNGILWKWEYYTS